MTNSAIVANGECGGRRCRRGAGQRDLGPADGDGGRGSRTHRCDAEPRIPEPWRPLPEVDLELLALAGPWYWGTHAYALRLVSDGGLELEPLRGGGRRSRFRAGAEGTWTGLDGYYAGETLRVVRRDDRSVSHLDLGSFVFTREPYEPGDAVPGGVDPPGGEGSDSEPLLSRTPCFT